MSVGKATAVVFIIAQVSTHARLMFPMNLGRRTGVGRDLSVILASTGRKGHLFLLHSEYNSFSIRCLHETPLRHCGQSLSSIPSRMVERHGTHNGQRQEYM
jgi:hypothetical protein